MEVGGADLLGEDGRIALGKVPEVVEVEDDAGGGNGGGAKPEGAFGAGEGKSSDYVERRWEKSS